MEEPSDWEKIIYYRTRQIPLKETNLQMIDYNYISEDETNYKLTTCHQREIGTQQ